MPNIPLRHGAFLPPFHPMNENPAACMERDLELMQWLDRLGFHEAWIGEHHSAGWELISSPELFIAVAAGRTKWINFGTGVISLPYHNPLMTANRKSEGLLLTCKDVQGFGPSVASTWMGARSATAEPPTMARETPRTVSSEPATAHAKPIRNACVMVPVS